MWRNRLLQKSLSETLTFVTFLAFCIGGSVARAEETGYVDGQVIVRTIEPTSLANARAWIDDDQFSIEETLIEELGIFLVRIIDSGLSVPDACTVLKLNPKVSVAKPDLIATFFQHYPNDDEFWNLWHLHETQYQWNWDVEAPGAWDWAVGGPGLYGQNHDNAIAIHDFQPHPTLPDLAENVWVNYEEIPGNGIDDDDNGVVDEYRIYNAELNNGWYPTDVPNTHGNRVAGQAGAVGNNSYLVAGMNWTGKLMLIGFAGNESHALRGFRFVMSKADRWYASRYAAPGPVRGANVSAVNLSWGFVGRDCEVDGEFYQDIFSTGDFQVQAHKVTFRTAFSDIGAAYLHINGIEC